MPRYKRNNGLVRKLFYDENEKCCWQIYNSTEGGTILYKYPDFPTYKVERKPIPYDKCKFSLTKIG